MIEIVTPMNIGDYKLQQVLELLEDSEIGSAKKRLNLVRILYEVLGYNLSPDVALAAAAEYNRLLVIATAGGGKTTWAMIKAILQKILRDSKAHPGHKVNGDDILCLVYNKHNAPDVEEKQFNMVSRLSSGAIAGLKIDDRIYARTMHKFAEYWRKQYTVHMNLVGYESQSEDEAVNMMERSIRIAFKQIGITGAEKISAHNMLGFYNYYKERMCTLEDLEDDNKFVDLQVSLDKVKVCFERYEAAKNRGKKYDYVDLLINFENMLRTNAEVKQQIQKYYEYVIADEVQDFTPLMWSILELIVDDGTPLVCVGDDDQEIYHFRGADVQLMLDFNERFPDGKAFMLNVNRRCSAKVLEEAKSVISKNTLRFDKPLVGTKPGGEVNYISYKTQEGQLNNLLRHLQALKEDDWYDTVVCYRETQSSVLLAELLAERGLPFYLISGYAPYTYELYKHVFDVLNILYTPHGEDNLINLYKVLPIQKNEMKAILESPLSKGKSFTELDYGKFMNHRNFTDVLAKLEYYSNKIDTEPLESIFTDVFSLMSKYFWTYKKSLMKNEKLAEIMEERVKRFFNVRITYEQLLIKLQEEQSKLNVNDTMRNGIALSTFHGVKGLEFKHVFVIDLEDSIFPNFDIIDSKPYTADDKVRLKEAERRLWYVVITRAKENFTAFYDELNPSFFVRESLNLSMEKPEAVTEATTPFIASDSLGQKLSEVTTKRVMSFEDKIKSITQSSHVQGQESVISTCDVVVDDFDFIDDLKTPDDFELAESNLLKTEDTSDVKSVVPVTFKPTTSPNDMSRLITPTLLQSDTQVQKANDNRETIESFKKDETASKMLGNYMNNLLNRF